MEQETYIPFIRTTRKGGKELMIRCGEQIIRPFACRLSSIKLNPEADGVKAGLGMYASINGKQVYVNLTSLYEELASRVYVPSGYAERNIEVSKVSVYFLLPAANQGGICNPRLEVYLDFHRDTWETLPDALQAKIFAAVTSYQNHFLANQQAARDKAARAAARKNDRPNWRVQRAAYVESATLESLQCKLKRRRRSDKWPTLRALNHHLRMGGDWRVWLDKATSSCPTWQPWLEVVVELQSDDSTKRYI